MCVHVASKKVGEEDIFSHLYQLTPIRHVRKLKEIS